MRSKLLPLLLALSVLLTFSSKGFAQDVLCVHFHEKIVHVESEGDDLPMAKDELHVKLVSELTGKFFKISLDSVPSPEERLLPLVTTHRSYAKIPSHRRQAVFLNPIKTVRLLI